MYSSQALRNQFTDSALQTASGPRIVVMCYDRLDRDLGEAIDALATKDLQRAHLALCHAQDLVHELLCMLDRDVWEHAGTLADLYVYIGKQLAAANMAKSPAITAEARHLLAELGDAFRTAAGHVAAPVGTAASTVSVDGAESRWSVTA
ncbi:MAG: flagellar export chaperone FliS [Acidimicrobiia bacterium]